MFYESNIAIEENYKNEFNIIRNKFNEISHVADILKNENMELKEK